MNQYLSSFFLVAFIGVLASGLAQPVLAGGGVNLIVVTTTADGLDNSDGKCSLREAIRNANTNSSFSPLVGECVPGSAGLTDVIVLESGQTYSLTVPGNGDDQGDLNILPGPAQVDLRIRSSNPGVRAQIIQGVAGQRVMAIEGARVELEDLTIQNGNTPGIGGGIANTQGHLTLRSVNVANNTAGHGGGVANSGFLLVENSDVQFNQAQHEGGGIHQIGSGGDAPGLIISGSRIMSNSAQRGGGLLNDSDWVLLHNDVEFINNTASTGDGGGALSNGGYLDVENTHFVGNTAAGNGGGVAVLGEDASLYLSGGFLHGNQAVRGGAAYVEPGKGFIVHVQDADLRDNIASDRGGALFGPNTFSTRSYFENNRALIGGALYATQAVSFRDSEAFENRATHNGGAIRGTYVTSVRSLIRNNSAQQGDGGGIWAGRRHDLDDVTLRNNTAGRDGGGLFLYGTFDVTVASWIRRSAIVQNVAANQGGGLGLFRDGFVRLTSSTISGNHAGTGGGVYLEEDATLEAWQSHLR